MFAVDVDISSSRVIWYVDRRFGTKIVGLGAGVIKGKAWLVWR